MFRRITVFFISLIVMLWLSLSGNIHPSAVTFAAVPTNVPTAEPTAPPTIVVNSTADNPEGCPETCTLRSAIAMAQDDDIIGFDSNIKGAIILTKPLVIEHNIALIGPGADLLAIDGDQKGRVFNIQYSMVRISGLTIQHGLTIDNEHSGAGIYNLGDLTISDSVITENVSQGSGGGIGSYGKLSIINSTISKNAAKDFGGGGIDSNGKLTITNCTITENEAEQNGGGILITDGNGGETEITNTTIAENKSQFSGGGLANGSTDSGGKVTILFSTIASNTSGFEGGGIDNSSGSLIIGSSIIADNTDNFKHPDIGGVVKSLGFNLIGDPSDVKGWLKSDQRKVEPLLMKLALNAPGTTKTMALEAGSPAISKGGKKCAETDQRGITRKNPCDVGAFETEKSAK